MWSDLVSVVGNDTAPYWELLMPKIYYKDRKPYGIIGYTQEPTLITVYTSMIGDKFTLSMIRDIIRLYHSNNLCLIADNPEVFDSVKKVLARYDFTHIRHIDESDREWLYSFHYWELEDGIR